MTTNAVPTPMHQTRTRTHRVAAAPWAPTKFPRAASVTASVSASTSPVYLFPQFEQAVAPTQAPVTPVAAATGSACRAPRKVTRKRDASGVRKHLYPAFSGAS
jgi:hypothetical protein